MVSATCLATSGRSRKLISFQRAVDVFGVRRDRQAVHPEDAALFRPRSLPAGYRPGGRRKPSRSIPSRVHFAFHIRVRRVIRVKRCDVGHQLFQLVIGGFNLFPGRWCCRNSPAYAAPSGTPRARRRSAAGCFCIPASTGSAQLVIVFRSIAYSLLTPMAVAPRYRDGVVVIPDRTVYSASADRGC